MKSKRKQFVRSVTALVDADATYVSLVSAGANGSPFNVVKQENPTMGVKIKPRTALPKAKGAKTDGAATVRKNANNRVAKGKEALAEASVETRAITKFFYSKEDFDSEAAVREHLGKSDFEGSFSVEEADDQFVVTATDVDTARIAKSAIVETGDDGVTAEVSILKDSDSGTTTEADEEDDSDEEDDADEDDSTIEKSEDDATEEEGEEEDPETEDDADDEKPVVTQSKKAQFLADLADEEDEQASETVEATLQKFDFWEVYDSASSDFLTLLKEGCSDGLAPGFDDVMWTFGQSIRKTLAGDDEAEGPLKKNAEDFCNVVLGMHNLFANIVNADMGVIEKADKDRAGVLTKWAKSFGKDLVSKAARGNTTVVNVAKTEAAAVPDITAAIAAAMAPMSEQLASVVKTVDKLSNRRQVSKGIDPADASTSEDSQKTSATQKKTDNPTAAKANAERLAKSIFAAR